MNSWIFYALLAPAAYAAINYVDKYLIESKVKDYRGMPLYSAIAGSVFGTAIWFSYGFPLLTLTQGLLVIMTGVLSVIALALYFKSLAEEETSIIIILFQLGPVFSLTLSYFLLGEAINAVQLSGFVLILISAIGASIKFAKNSIKLTNAFWLILINDFLWALANVLFKFVSNENSFSTLIIYEGWGFGIGGLILWFLYPSAKKAFQENVRAVGKSVMSIIFVNEGLFVLARLLTYFALTMASIALVTVLGSTQVFFGLGYGIILTLLFPKIFKEEINIKNLSKKLIFALLATGGIVLVNW